MRNADSEQGSQAAFDFCASSYDEQLAQGLSVSGESKDYFAHGRMAWLAGCLRRLGAQPRCAMDFGCGTGSGAPLLLELLGATSVIAVDSSPKLVEQGEASNRIPGIRFSTTDAYRPDASADLVFCNGVFHHIPPQQRAEAIRYIFESLCRGGIFAFWENNPWNPGTRYVMSRIPFDRDAITLTAPQSRALLRSGGFEILRTDFYFIFPKFLSWFRSLEPMLARFPLGAQYQILCRKL